MDRTDQTVSADDVVSAAIAGDEPAFAALTERHRRELHGVLGLVERGEHAVAVDVQLTPVPLGQGGECGLIHPQPLLRSTSCSSQTLPSGSAKSANDW